MTSNGSMWVDAQKCILFRRYKFIYTYITNKWNLSEIAHSHLAHGWIDGNCSNGKLMDTGFVVVALWTNLHKILYENSLKNRALSIA